jgi:hypothetical protein
VPALIDAPQIQIVEDPLPFEESKDPNTKTHFVNPPKNLHIWRVGMDIYELVDIARANGLEVEALCGYRWVPKHNPDKYDLCDTCNKIAHEMMAERGE